MEPDILKLLEETIEEFKKVVSGEIHDHEVYPLCKHLSFAMCVECPVENETGSYSCLNTPIHDFRASQSYRLQYSRFGGMAYTPELKAKAQAGLDFLISLYLRGKFLHDPNKG